MFYGGLFIGLSDLSINVHPCFFLLNYTEDFVTKSQTFVQFSATNFKIGGTLETRLLVKSEYVQTLKPVQVL